MSDHQKHIREELEELGAKHLSDWNKLPSEEMHAGLSEKLIDQVIQNVSSEKKTNVINLKPAINREAKINKSLLLRIAAAFAGVILLMNISYNIMTKPVATCEGEERLACLLEKTSEEDIYQYLLESGMPEDDDYLISIIDDGADVSATDLMEIELQ